MHKANQAETLELVNFGDGAGLARLDPDGAGSLGGLDRGPFALDALLVRQVHM